MNNHFPQNLSILRHNAGYTQETLAETLGVSRQAVGKWESGQALPEAATLLTLADLLGCTLDELMRQPLTEDGQVDILAIQREQAQLDQAAYDAYHAHVGTVAKRMAGGVCLVLAGVTVAAFTAALELSEWTPIAAFFLFLMAAVFLFVTGGMAEDDFKEDHPEILPLFDPREKAAFQKKFRLVMGLCVVGILGATALTGILATMVGEEPSGMHVGTLFMGILTLCVPPIVYMACLSDRYKLEEMSQRARKRNPDLGGPIMIFATAAFLIWGLVWDGWKISWVCFIIGGGLCALAEALGKQER